jgi:hypothetical protein
MEALKLMFISTKWALNITTAPFLLLLAPSLLSPNLQTLD